MEDKRISIKINGCDLQTMYACYKAQDILISELRRKTDSNSFDKVLVLGEWDRVRAKLDDSFDITIKIQPDVKKCPSCVKQSVMEINKKIKELEKTRQEIQN